LGPDGQRVDETLAALKADIICLQETKITRKPRDLASMGCSFSW